ncbi:nuclear transport factor 2 family protein [Actinomadura opuntiae]|uniref:nuclear transport factor 2 family protein n=1 Tax=Actinomadura sp. OS1-43 TaxID=604315 RepID=UPI00255AC841|nr:nuclear transport factor 2 family protein [Actinomadura sp. OS1-43]MDL4813020.1 nuclear transport factor 2 family protein [Actinomadura sp. OS1-43]
MTAPAPREVFERLSAGISAGRWHELAGLYAEDAVVEQPFTLPPAPRRLEGRAVIAEHFRRAAAGPLQLRARDVVVHETDDPEVIVSEFGYEGRVATTGHEFRVANVQVLRVRGGLIVESRDYHDHRGLARAMNPAGTAP